MQNDPCLEMIEEILSNPYFSAGFGLIGVGTSLAVLKQGAVRGADLIRRQLLMTLEISSKDKSYSWVLQWLTSQVAKNTQHLSVQTTFRQHENGSCSTQFSMIPSPGVHYMKWNSRWFKVQRERERSMMDIASGNPFETVTITTVGQDRRIFDQMLNEARIQALQKEIGKTVIFTSWANEWRPFGLPRRKRKLDSVILDDGISEKILQDIKEFNNNGKWYFDRGIPYRRGYLLHGPPGTGKSSFIQALAGELDYNICIINLSENVVTDDRFNYLLSVLPERSFLLLEDIDAAFLKRDSQM